MKIGKKKGLVSIASNHAFTLVEAMVAVAVSAIAFLALYSALASGFSVIQTARENLRATQIVQEKMEVIRLYTWEQINSNGFVPSTFTATFYPAATNGNQGFTYRGTVTITNSGFSEAYSADHRKLIVTLGWTNSGMAHARECTSLVSKYGIHQYVYTQK